MKNQIKDLRPALLEHLKSIGAEKLPDRVIDSIQGDLEEKIDEVIKKNVTIKSVTRHFQSAFAGNSAG